MAFDRELYHHGIAKLVSLLQTFGEMEDFDVTAWLLRWLHEPLPAWGGECPIDRMGSAEGQDQIATVLAMMQSGCYA
jgi:hypothetical protein